MHSKFIKVILSSTLITAITVVISFVASKHLDPTEFGNVIFIQTVIMLTVQISLWGIDYNVLRNCNGSHIELGGFSLELSKIILLFITVLVAIMVFMATNQVSINFSSLCLLFIASCSFALTALTSSFQRIFGYYHISTLQGRGVVIASALILLILLSKIKLSTLDISLVFAITGGVFCCVSLILLSRSCKLAGLIQWKFKKPVIDESIYIYFANITMISVGGLERYFIGTRLSFSDIAVWYVYAQIMLPFQFISKSFYQVAIPEIAQGRLIPRTRNMKKYFKTLIIFFVVIFSVASLVFTKYYKDKYNIDIWLLFVVALTGFFYLSYTYFGSIIEAIGNRRILIINNFITSILGVSLISFYAFGLRIGPFPWNLSIALMLFWLLKNITGVFLYMKLVTQMSSETRNEVNAKCNVTLVDSSSAVLSPNHINDTQNISKFTP